MAETSTGDDIVCSIDFCDNFPDHTVTYPGSNGAVHLCEECYRNLTGSHLMHGIEEV